jgi:transposase-like protein
MTMGRYRVHSPEFKLHVVREVAEGHKTPAQACREYDIGESLLLRWRKQYAARGGAAFTERDQPDEIALARRVAELERLCGQLALENAVLKKALGHTRLRSATR